MRKRRKVGGRRRRRMKKRKVGGRRRRRMR